MCETQYMHISILTTYSIGISILVAVAAVYYYVAVLR